MFSERKTPALSRRPACLAYYSVALFTGLASHGPHLPWTVAGSTTDSTSDAQRGYYAMSRNMAQAIERIKRGAEPQGDDSAPLSDQRRRSRRPLKEFTAPGHRVPARIWLRAHGPQIRPHRRIAQPRLRPRIVRLTEIDVAPDHYHITHRHWTIHPIAVGKVGAVMVVWTNGVIASNAVAVLHSRAITDR